MHKDHEVGKDDLRWKLIRKNLSRRKHLVAKGQHDVDLHEKLSRNVHALADPMLNNSQKNQVFRALGEEYLL